MKYDLLIKNGHVVDPANAVNGLADVAFSDGKVAEVGADLSLFEARNRLDAAGLLVVPGVIDPHTHTVRPGSQGSAYKMLLRCGVTTTMDMRGPVETFLEEMRTVGAGINAACCNAVFPEKDIPGVKPDGEKIRAFIEKRMQNGAFGIKIMGGHYPFTPEVTGRIFEECAALKRYVAIHCGSTETGSNIKGLLEAVALAEGRPLHIAHINAYCRGMVSDVLEETLTAMNALRDNPNIISESYLSVMNGTYCTLDSEGNIESRVTRNCLRMRGYPENPAGLEKAILDGYCVVYSLAGGEMQLLPPKVGHAHWKSFPSCQCTFPVNDAIALVSCATSRRKDGSFVVDGLCSDGGANPRNVIFRNGLLLVKARYLTLDDLVRKTSLYPARMLGLTGKGHLTPGADGDVAVFDPDTGDAVYSLTNGVVRMARGVCADAPGTVITTADGVNAVKKAGLSSLVPNLADSGFLNRALLTA
ncbi:MAG: amidohydrolase family protein [Deltaproteobacteria bacterium]|jgi:imidazolonepropionase-like amidohydrolase|nr:amidohydrolase family protein [Deltaproteobacteria bacterium]